MINIGALLDACGISYTEKQLKKLDRLFNQFLKGKFFKNFQDTNSENVNQYEEPENNIAIKEESVEEEVLEMKYEIDPLAFFEADENSKCNIENNRDDNSMLAYPEFKKELSNVSHIYKNESRNNETDTQKSEIEYYSYDVAFKLEEDMMSVHEEKKQHKSVPKEIKAFKCNICEYETPKNDNLFMKESNHLNVQFVCIKL